MKKQYEIREITKDEALEMVKKYHYSQTLANLNKIFLGFFLEDRLVGVVTLGWGTRPLHTIRKIFPSLETKDYYEIGRMCMTEDMERNSESQMLSQLVKYIKVNYPDIKVLFTWADGMLGKAGYVYQASNFYYAGFFETDTYLKDGVRIHPRKMKNILGMDDDKRKTVRPTPEQRKQYDIGWYKGRQFRYIYFTCDKKEKKRLMKECQFELSKNYPKQEDLKWRVKDENNKWVDSDMPPFKTDSKSTDFMKSLDWLK